MRIDGPSTNFNVVAGNRIGTNAAGTAGIGNASGGIAITNSAANNTIGGPSGGNLIAFNTGGDGVNVAADAGTGNAILGNSIHTNTELGIDLLNDGVTSNDLGDPDPGPNLLQNFPALSGAVSVGGNVHVAGSLNGAASTTYRVELFANSVAVADEGERFLGALNVLTDAGGNVPFGATFVASVSPGELITATATDPANNTSELSAPLAVVGHLLVTTTSDVAGRAQHRHDHGARRQSRTRRSHLAARGDPRHERHRRRATPSGSGSPWRTQATCTTRTMRSRPR